MLTRFACLELGSRLKAALIIAGFVASLHALNHLLFFSFHPFGWASQLDRVWSHTFNSAYIIINTILYTPEAVRVEMIPSLQCTLRTTSNALLTHHHRNLKEEPIL
ncbi:hypothetical protein OUZ56_008308 [Daphnia magna]|uniref:Uncharacterized protein n=1 Tax=Daphnia magna TaxID=35525 RepID=A0ABR0ACK7_9CRUS|nr:hypothetical protein OUZ56_008308 [Daphnia magna]